jgi:hypothetical protein
MQVAELWRLTVGWCGIKGRQSVVCLRVGLHRLMIRYGVPSRPLPVGGGSLNAGGDQIDRLWRCKVKLERGSSSATTLVHVLSTSSHPSSCFV